MTNDEHKYYRFTFSSIELAVILESLRKTSLTCNDRDDMAGRCELLITFITDKVKADDKR